jgi:Flp pilus assembly pilin Flp
MTPFIVGIIVQCVGTPSSPGAARPTFSPDGLWWWDGAEWKPAISPDGRWRWNGTSWVAAQAYAQPRRRGGATTAVIITIAAFGGVLVLVALVTIAVLFTMGNQIANVFSNVVAALGSSPSP